MDYVLLSVERQAALYRGVLLQAESDHLLHSLSLVEATTARDTLPAPVDGDPHADARFNVDRRVEERTALVAAAEAQGELAEAALDRLGQPYQPGDPD